LSVVSEAITPLSAALISSVPPVLVSVTFCCLVQPSPTALPPPVPDVYADETTDTAPLAICAVFAVLSVASAPWPVMAAAMFAAVTSAFRSLSAPGV
jgi:hypothetical protein